MSQIPGQEKIVPPSQVRPRGTAGLLLAAIFASGGVLGAGLAVVWMQPGQTSRKRAEPPASYQELYDRQVEAMALELKLTDQQKPAVRKAVTEVYGPIRQELMERMAPLMKRAYTALGAEVWETLTPAQREAWGRYVERRMAWVTMDPMMRKKAGQPASAPADLAAVLGSYEEVMDRQIERIVSEVKLTKEQESQVREAWDRVYGPVWRGVRQKANQAMIPAYEALRAEVLKVLTPEQAPAWEKYVQRRVARAKMDLAASRPASEPAPTTGPAK